MSDTPVEYVMPGTRWPRWKIVRLGNRQFGIDHILDKRHAESTEHRIEDRAILTINVRKRSLLEQRLRTLGLIPLEGTPDA